MTALIDIKTLTTQKMAAISAKNPGISYELAEQVAKRFVDFSVKLEWEIFKSNYWIK